MNVAVRASWRSDEGFTLLELLIVIAILGMLAVVGTLQLMSYLDRARTDTARLQVSSASTWAVYRPATRVLRRWLRRRKPSMDGGDHI